MVGQDHIDLKAVRTDLGMSQVAFADLLGVSERTVQSCEQGWRKPSAAVEKAAILLLLTKRHGPGLAENVCWEVMGCSEEERNACIAYQSRQGHLCWLLTGNVCKGKSLHTWNDKKAVCMRCDFFRSLLPGGPPTR